MIGSENSLSYSKLEQAAVIEATAEKDEGAHRTEECWAYVNTWPFEYRRSQAETYLKNSLLLKSRQIEAGKFEVYCGKWELFQQRAGDNQEWNTTC